MNRLIGFYRFIQFVAGVGAGWFVGDILHHVNPLPINVLYIGMNLATFVGMEFSVRGLRRRTAP